MIGDNLETAVGVHHLHDGHSAHQEEEDLGDVTQRMDELGVDEPVGEAAARIAGDVVA